jgi:hypothetical protein
VEYQSLLKAAPEPEQLGMVPTLPLFSEKVLHFIDALSSRLFRLPEARTFPELTALAFWMRKANLERVHSEMQSRIGDALLVPRGTIFHIAPSNVDTIFVYSWFLSLLMGNRNILRLSSKPSRQTDLLISTISDLLVEPEHGDIAARSLIVRYAPNDKITARLSAVADVRVIWGGDSTIEQIRRIALKPTAFDVAFASKFSLAIVDAQRYMAADEAQKLNWAEAFYNDSYWFDQMACSSPRLLLWIGQVEKARKAGLEFWPRLEACIARRHTRFEDSDYVNKLVASNLLAIEADIQVLRTATNNLTRIWLDVPALNAGHHCGAGLFFETALASLDDLLPLLNRSVQTVSYAAFTKDELRSFASKSSLSGIDRMVPFGRALDFSNVWDGFDLFRTFTREISIS